tara:strand:- start:996 stop:1214 length:219 start_codon:yes stop_codon:yes gene_type:complete
MKSLILALFVIGIIICSVGYQNKLIKGIETVNTRVEYRFIPRNIYEDQFGSPNLEQSFQDMFENQDVFFKTV